MTAKDKGTSVLASLTASVMETKVAASRQLTPVAGEARALPKTSAPFPNDIPQEVVEQKAFDLTRIIGELTQARDALLSLVNAPLPDAVVDLDAVRKEKEAAADRVAAERDVAAVSMPNVPAMPPDDEQVEFDADLAAKTAAAQAATFQSEVEKSVPAEWICPEHGKSGIEKTSSGGRPYIGCPDCKLFKR